MSLSAKHLGELRATFNSGKTRSYEWRYQQLQQLLKLVDENEQLFMDAFKKDSGKAEATTLAGEILFTRGDLTYVMKNLKKWMKPARVPSPMFLQPLKSRIDPTPYGVVLLGAAWNFPMQLTVAPLAAALAAGNCALIKPPSLSPNFCKLIAELIPKYMDPDAVRVFQPEGEERDVLLRQRFDLIMYTGSYNVGKVVMRAAAENLVPVLLELGGKNPCIIAEDANLEVAANRILDAKGLNAGQVCVNVDYIVCHESIKPKLLAILKEKVEYMYGKDQSKSNVMSRIINKHHLERLKGLLASGDIVVGGKTDDSDNFMDITVLDNVSVDSPVMQDEIFGPILPVLTYKTKQDIMDIYYRYGKPLCFYIFTENKAFAEDLINSTQSGAVGVNSIMFHVPNHKLPFGGVGESGMGRYHGKYGFESFSHLRAVVSKPTWLDIKQSYPPFTDDELAQRNKFMRWLMK